MIKLLHLNILGGIFLPEVISFIKDNDFDIIHLQEVAHGDWLPELVSNDNFKKLSDELSEYKGILAPAMGLIADPAAYFGNATFCKKNLQATDLKTIWLKEYKKIDQVKGRTIEDDVRNAISIKYNINNKPIYFINAHLAWGPTPTDANFKTEQATILYNYLKSLDVPFVLSGDFNMTPGTELVKMFDKLGTNLTVKHNYTNTLNPRIHRAKDLFPKGHAVDFIYHSSSVKNNSFKIIEDLDLSDHFALTAEFEI